MVNNYSFSQSQPDSIRIQGDTIKPKEKKSSIGTTITYTADDSIRFDVKEQKVYLYGNAVVVYGTKTLKSDRMIIDWQNSLVTSTFSVDSTGRKRGIPVFKDGNDMYSAEKIRYNYKTEKGFISDIVTKEGEGYLAGKDGFKDSDDNLYLKNASYTTCNHAEPHYHFQMRRTKAIPDKKVYTSVCNLYIDKIPTPLVLPFGIFPTKDRKASGIVFPQYGESVQRGFFLTDGGYYLSISDYVSVKLLGEVYSKGGYGLSMLTSYKNRYRYDGNFSFAYRNAKYLDQIDGLDRVDFNFRWQHNPKPRGPGRFSSNVNFATATFYQRNAINNPQAQIAGTINSNINYTRSFKKLPLNLSTMIRHEQNNQTRIANFTLPSFNLSMNRVFIFKGKNSPSKKSYVRTFYESVGVQYQFDGQFKTSTGPIGLQKSLPFKTIQADSNIGFSDTVNLSLANVESILKRGEFAYKHRIPITANAKIGKFSINPSFNYDVYWYNKKFDYRYLGGDSVDISVDHGLHQVHAYNYRIDATTTMYGMYRFRGKNAPQIRHTLRPTVGYSASPDYTDLSRGIFTEVQKDTLGNIAKINRYNGLEFGAPVSSKSESIVFGVSNVIEMKKRSAKDTVTGFKKIKLIENLSINSSYNMAAKEFKLSRFNVSANTNLFGKININLSGILDPYMYKADSIIGSGKTKKVYNQKRIDTFAWDTLTGLRKLGKFETVNLALATNLNPQAFKRKYVAKNEQQAAELAFLNANPNMYVDFTIPWSLNLSYNLRYSQVGFQPKSIIQVINTSGDVKLTDNWKVGFNVSYDVTNKVFTQPRLNIYRDLHCWEMQATWVPFGVFQQYNFSINIKSAMLRDLRLSRNRNFYNR